METSKHLLMGNDFTNRLNYLEAKVKFLTTNSINIITALEERIKNLEEKDEKETEK